MHKEQKIRAILFYLSVFVFFAGFGIINQFRAGNLLRETSRPAEEHQDGQAHYKQGGPFHYFPLIAAMKNPIRVNTDINSSLPAHIWTI